MTTSKPASAFRLTDLKDVQPHARYPLTPTSLHYVGGNFPEMAQLAGRLYDFALKSNAHVKSIAPAIEALVGEDGRWKGQASIYFREALGADIILMDGLAHMVSGMAQLIDQLASELSVEESRVEQVLNALRSQGFLSMSDAAYQGDDNLLLLAHHLKLAESVILTEKGVRLGGNDIPMAGVACENAANTAKRLKKQLLAEVTDICEKLTRALDLYTDRTKSDLTMREEHLLNGKQILSDQQGNKDLEKRYQDAIAKSGLSAGDMKGAVGAMSKLGGDAQIIGGLAIGYKGFKSAGWGSRLETVSGTAEKVGPVLGDLGLIALAAE